MTDAERAARMGQCVNWCDLGHERIEYGDEPGQRCPLCKAYDEGYADGLDEGRQNAEDGHAK